LYLVFVGENLAFSIISLILSTQVKLAASISTISINFSSKKSVHTSHFKQGFHFFGDMQLTAFANILAVEVFHVPLGPQNK